MNSAQQPDGAVPRWVWRAHVAILFLAVGGYVVVNWSVLTRGPVQASGREPVLELLTGVAQGLESLAAVQVLIALLVYAAVTSVIMIWARRSVWSLPLIHGVAFAAVAIGEGYEEQERAAQEAAYRASPEYIELEQERHLESCWTLEAVVILEPTPRAEVTVTNATCPFPITVAGPDLDGWGEDGSLDSVDGSPAPLVALEPGVTHTFEVELFAESDEGESDEGGLFAESDEGESLQQWDWYCSVGLQEPISDSWCFESNASQSDTTRCRPLSIVFVAP